MLFCVGRLFHGDQMVPPTRVTIANNYRFATTFVRDQFQIFLRYKLSNVSVFYISLIRGFSLLSKTGRDNFVKPQGHIIISPLISKKEN